MYNGFVILTLSLKKENSFVANLFLRHFFPGVIVLKIPNEFWVALTPKFGPGNCLY